jgi:hypothetical protein
VKKILRGFRREETERFIAFRSHWRFASEFCTPYEAHEKGGIEGEAGYFRRNHWVPMPKARDLAELNVQLLAACHEDEQRQIAGRSQPVGAAMIEERAHLLPLAEQGFELAEVCFPRVDGLGCVRVRTNLYSVPVKPDKTVEVHRDCHVPARSLGLHCWFHFPTALGGSANSAPATSTHSSRIPASVWRIEIGNHVVCLESVKRVIRFELMLGKERAAAKRRTAGEVF